MKRYIIAVLSVGLVLSANLAAQTDYIEKMQSPKFDMIWEDTECFSCAKDPRGTDSQDESVMRAQEILTLTGSALWTGISDVEFKDWYAYCATRSGLQVFAVGGFSGAELIAQVPLPQSWEGSQLTIDGDHVFYGGRNRLYIIDISSPQTPSLVATQYPVGLVDDVQIIGERLIIGIAKTFGDYGSDYPSLYIYDISTMTSPITVGKYTSPASYKDSRRFSVIGERLYALNHWSDRLEVVSIADENQPNYVRSISIDRPRAIDNTGGRLIVATSGSVICFSLDDPDNPVELATTVIGPTVRSLDAIDSTVICGADPGLRILNLSETGELVELSSCELSGLPGSVSRWGSNIFCPGYLSGWSVVDVSDLLNPNVILEYSTTNGTLREIQIAGDHAYLGGYHSKGMFVVDISDRTNPAFIRKIETVSAPHCLFAYDNSYLLEASTSCSRIYSLADPANPVLAGTIDGRGANSYAVRDTFLLAAGANGLDIFGFADPTQPVLLANFKVLTDELLRNMMHVTLHDDIAYVCEVEIDFDFDSRIYLTSLDLSQPSEPVLEDEYIYLELASSDAFAVEYEQCFLGDEMFLSSGTLGLFTFDLRDPTHPDVTSVYSLENEDVYYTDVIRRRNYLFLAGMFSIEVLDITNVDDPQPVQVVPLNALPYHMDMEGNYLHVATWGGYYIYEINLEPADCGDIDVSGSIDIDDVVALIEYVFQGGNPPDPVDAGDVNCLGGVDIDDIVYLIAYVFQGGTAPCDVNGDGIPDCEVQE